MASAMPAAVGIGVGGAQSVKRPVRAWRTKMHAAPATTPPAPAAAVSDDSVLALPNVRTALIRQEDTIIFNLIERAQHALNSAVYTPDAIPVPGFRVEGSRFSLLEYMLHQTETRDGSVRRYLAPDEHAFFPDRVPMLVLPPMLDGQEDVLAPYASEININGEVMDLYLDNLLPLITSPGDDGHYGSSALADINCLQALSKRIHYGKYVAEAKFRAQPELYSELIAAQDARGIMDLLTDRAVELKVVERVRRKAATFGQDITAEGELVGEYKVSPDVVADLYDRFVMPLTKDVQVAYLLRRLETEQ